jgi:hypothetical protein
LAECPVRQLAAVVIAAGRDGRELDMQHFSTTSYDQASIYLPEERQLEFIRYAK